MAVLKTILISDIDSIFGQSLNTLLKISGYNVIPITKYNQPGCITWNQLNINGLPFQTKIHAIINILSQPTFSPQNFLKIKKSNEFEDFHFFGNHIFLKLIRSLPIELRPSVYINTSSIIASQQSNSLPEYISKISNFYSRLEHSTEEMPIAIFNMRLGCLIDYQGGIIHEKADKLDNIGCLASLYQQGYNIPWIHIKDAARLYIKILDTIENISPNQPDQSQYQSDEINETYNFVAPIPPLSQSHSNSNLSIPSISFLKKLSLLTPQYYLKKFGFYHMNVKTTPLNFKFRYPTFLSAAQSIPDIIR